jgi:hypothetical protein
MIQSLSRRKAMDIEKEIEKLLKKYKSTNIEKNKNLETFLETIDSNWDNQNKNDISTDCHASHSSHGSHCNSAQIN